MTVNGTLIIMPENPHNDPQTEREIKATNGLIFKDLPAILGSIKFVTVNNIVLSKTSNSIELEKFPY